MQLNLTLLVVVMAVIFIGLLLLSLAFAVEFFLPLVGLEIVAIVAYLAYKVTKARGMA